MSSWTAEDVARHNARLAPKAKRSKYGSVKTVVDGIAFDSKKEAQRYSELKLLRRAGQIEDLELQPAFSIIIVSLDSVATYIGEYRADFRYRASGHLCVEDVKSKATRTEAYRLRKKLVEALYGIVIQEV